MNKDNYCIIMAGGIGSRFWPLSKTSRPKQFIDILGTGETMIQTTFARFEKICPRENIFIVTSSIYADLVNEQIPNLNPNQIIAEPTRRNTAPCSCPHTP
jgi:mannose-1-phosphate guanylyltransferase